jgi:hypothetical protein
MQVTKNAGAFLEKNFFLPELSQMKSAEIMKHEILDGDREMEPGEVRFSEVIRWVLEHNDSYPLSPDATWSAVYYDIAPCLTTLNHAHFINITKKQFGGSFGVKQSQVSRWIRAGLPVRTDGRINYGPAMDWLERYQQTNAVRKALGWKL